MDKRKFIKKYREKFNNEINRREALEDIDSFFEVLKISLEENRKVKFHEIGTFSVISKKNRIVSNPSTRERMKIIGKNTIKFKASSKLLKKLDSLKKIEDIVEAAK